MNRRRFLTGLGGAAAFCGLAGCSGILPSSEDSEDLGPDIYPPEGLDTDDELLTGVADPSFQIPPAFFSGYQYRLAEIRERLNPVETVPVLGGQFLSATEENIEVPIADVSRITGSNYAALSSGGAIGTPVPSGQTMHATGEFDVEPFVDWLDSVDGYQSISSDDSWDRYLAETQEGSGFETWALQDGRVIIVSRTEVTGRTDRYETNEQAAREALALELDQLERDDAPIANTAPDFADTVQQLNDGPIRAGTGYALIPRGADTGTAAFDDVVDGVAGGGLSATVESNPALQRAVTYLESELLSQDRLEAAFEASETGTVPTDRWEFSSSEATLSARATLDDLPDQAMLNTALPVPGYRSLFSRVPPGELGRTPTPRAVFGTDESADKVQITHDGGDAVEDLRVRYIHDGSVQRESWDGPVEAGDEFTSEQSVDPETQVWLVWRAETTDAAVLLRNRPS